MAKKTSNRVKAAIGGCLVALGNAVGAAILVMIGFGIYVKDTIANYMPDQFAGTPIAWVFQPPQADSPIKTTDTYGCELNWSRDVTGTMINYTVSCNGKAEKGVEFRNLKVEVLAPNESDIWDAPPIDSKVFAGPDTCKDKDPEGWPMDVPCYLLDDDERFEESGTFRTEGGLGDMNWGKFRRVVVTADVRYPDDKEKPDKSDKYRLRIASGEGE